MNSTTIVILWHPDHGFAFQYRDSQAPNFPNRWASFGGAIEDGETPLEGMYRELEEELGLAKDCVTNVHYFGEDEWNAHPQHIFTMKMVCGIDRINLQEGVGIGWFISLDEITNLNWGFNFPELIPQIAKTLSDPSAFFSDEHTGQDS